MPLLFGAVACGVPLSPVELTATAVNGGNLVPTPVDTVGDHVLASSVLAPILLDAPTPPPGATPAASGTLVLSGELTPAAGTPPPGAPAGGTPVAVTEVPGTPAPGSPTPPPTATPQPTATPIPATLPAGAGPGRTPTPFGGGSTTSSSAQSNGGDPASQELSEVNSARASRGLPALRANASLTADAATYAKYMGDKNYFAHDGLDGTTPSSRVASAGYKGRFKGEALAAGQASADGALNTWLGSPAHAAILLDSSAVDVGIGYYNKPGSSYSYYWVLVTGVP